MNEKEFIQLLKDIENISQAWEAIGSIASILMSFNDGNIHSEWNIGGRYEEIGTILDTIYRGHDEAMGRILGFCKDNAKVNKIDFFDKEDKDD